MAEMKGPGCIWRIWSAAAEKGHVKIYLDDQPEPAVDLPFADYFDGKHAPFSLSGALLQPERKSAASGQNLYLPIPYQKSCKVVADKGWGNYFHFNYATYPAGTTRAHLQRRAGRRACRAAPGGQRFLRQAAWAPTRPETRPGEATLSQAVAGRRRARRPQWPGSTARGRSPACG